MLCCYREAENTKLLTAQKQKVVEKEAEIERKKAVIGESPPQPTPPLSPPRILYVVYVGVCMLSLRRVTFLSVQVSGRTWLTFAN